MFNRFQFENKSVPVMLINDGLVSMNASLVLTKGLCDTGRVSWLVSMNDAFVLMNDAFVRMSDAFVRMNASFMRTNAAFIRMNASFMRTNASFMRTSDAFMSTSASFMRTNAAFVLANEGMRRPGVRRPGTERPAFCGAAGVVVEADPMAESPPFRIRKAAWVDAFSFFTL